MVDGTSSKGLRRLHRRATHTCAIDASYRYNWIGLFSPTHSGALFSKDIGKLGSAIAGTSGGSKFSGLDVKRCAQLCILLMMPQPDLNAIYAQHLLHGQLAPRLFSGS